LQISRLLDLNHTKADDYIMSFPEPWDGLKGLKEFILSLGNSLNLCEFIQISTGVWVHETAVISKSAHFIAPCIIDKGSEVREGAYVRGGVLAGCGCVIGNSTELKNCILFDGVQVPHFNYVGDSILGYKAHLGAGAITSNVKSDKTNIAVLKDDKKIDTGLKKFGAIVGDFAEVGCNSVLCPGTVIGRNTTVYPLTLVRGYIPENSILKHGGKLSAKR